MVLVEVAAMRRAAQQAVWRAAQLGRGRGVCVLAMYWKYLFIPFFSVPMQVLYVEYYILT